MGDVTFYTSGSSGQAKAIVRTERTLRADAEALARAFPEIWASRPAVVSTAPKDHLFGTLWRVLVPEVLDLVSDPEPVISIEQLAAAREKYERFLFATTPSFLEKALGHPDIAALRGAFVGIVTSGGLLRTATSRAVQETLGVCPLEIFGSTEAGTVAYRRQSEGELWNVFDGVSATTDAEGRLVVDSPYLDERPFVMSDAVVFEGPGRFRLLGRTDRRVKILEEFVSLPEVEARLEAHPLVERARAEAYGESVPRIGALVVLSPAGRERLAGSTYGALVAELRRDLLPAIGAAAFPRRIRFVRTLPTNERGKTTAADVRQELSAWCREPVVLAWRQTADALSATLVFPPDDEAFDGHFPGCPILPGVAQLYFLRHFARQAFVDFPDAADFRKLKFQKLILPSRPVTLSVRRLDAGRFDFAFAGTGGPCSSGLVEGRPAT